MRTDAGIGWRGRVVWCAAVAILCAAAGLLLPAWRAYHTAPRTAGQGRPWHAGPRETARGVVIDRTDSADTVTLRARVERGAHSGTEFTDTLLVDALRPARDVPRPGQRVLCRVAASRPVRGQVAGRVREWPLLVLAGVFLAVLGLVGGGPGMRTAASILIAVVAVVAVLLPLSRAGHDPLLVAIPVAAVVAASGILLIAGVSAKALSAIAGTVVGATLAGLVATLVGRHLAYTGLAIDFGPQLNLDVAYWYSRPLARVDFAGLLAAGMLISALGATMDVSVGVASAAAAVGAGARHLSRRQVALAGLRVGRDMMGTMAAALVFIYVGGGLLGFLALRAAGTTAGWLELMNYEAVGADVVRLLAGAIGLATAIPATALAAATLTHKRERDEA